MKLHAAQIENFKSLRRVKELEELGDLVIFVGSNSSGKSNILEALHLFFSQFSAVAGTTVGLAAHLWHAKVTTHPIAFTLTIELDDQECNDIIGSVAFEGTKKKFPERYRELVVRRRILSQAGNWQTEMLNLAHVLLVKNDKEVSDESFFKALELKLPYEFYFFTKDNSVENIGGQMLVVDPERKIAYYTDERINRFVRIGVMPSSTETWGQSFKDWVQEKGYQLIERPPTPQEVETPPSVHAVLENLSRLLKTGFRLIPNVRGHASIDVTKRTPQIPKESLETIQKLWQSEKPEDERIFSKFKRDLKTAFPGVLGFRPGFVDVEVSDTRIPIEYIGGGHQERFALQEHLVDNNIIYGLEEPEMHQHPESARSLFEFLKRESAAKQIFITTHSPIFMDPNNLKNVWIVQIEGIQTRVRQPTELREVLDSIGASPKDRFFPDKILFVEGSSDKTFISGAAEKSEINLTYVRIIPIYGKSKGRYNFDAWRNVVRGSQIQLLLMLDQDAKADVARLVKQKVVEPENFILLEGDLEDLYPITVLAEVVNEMWELGITREDLETGRRVDVIERLLQEKKKYDKRWKDMLAQKMVERIAKKDLPTQIKQVLQRLAN